MRTLASVGFIPVPDEPPLDSLVTEAWDPAAADLDLRSTEALVALMNEADTGVPRAIARARPSIVAAIDAIAARVGEGGRLVYVGAGTSGRLAVLDAAECVSTFSVSPERVVALIAGGSRSLATAQEQAEDDAAAGASEMAALSVGPADTVVGVSASGRTPYVLAALAEARRAGALTVGLACADGSPLAELTDHAIVVPVGPEVIAGSTRLKAGTAQKLVLNMISTITMVRLGKTYGNLMVDVVATNTKLRARVRRIVANATGASPERVEAALDAADGDAKVAIVALLSKLDAASARVRLDDAHGVVRRALAP